MTSTALPPGIILVAHEALAQIPQTEMLAAIAAEYRNLPREVIHLRAVKTTLSDLPEFDYSTARRRQAEEARERLQPLIEANPPWRVQYFGAAPIPLAMALGYQLGPWAPVDVYQQHHETKSWSWINQGRSNSAQFRELVLPKDQVDVAGDVVIRISMSHQIEAADTKAVIAESIGEIDIALQTPHEDAFASAADLDALGTAFDTVIDSLHRTRPNAQLHVFAAVTPGAAFKLGMAISPNIHSPIHTYQYAKRSSPHYSPVFVIQLDGPIAVVLSQEQVARAATLRTQYAEELRRLRDAAQRIKARGQPDAQSTWLSLALPQANHSLSGAVTKLPAIFDTDLVRSAVDTDKTVLDDSFQYDSLGRMWQFDDHFLSQLAVQFPQGDDVLQAGRLLLLHEAVHLAAHGLTEATSREIRRFPKILEELDYQADVWAFVHDYAVKLTEDDAAGTDPRAYFLKTVSVALDTFRAFDAASDSHRIETRRLNRYLIWYWQFLRLERCSTLSEILEVLAERPYIEVAGPRVESSGNRVYFSLDPLRFEDPELALLYRQRVIRIGHSPGSRVKDLLLGFRERDRDKIRDSLKSISDQIED